jgi:hypothetical protein
MRNLLLLLAALSSVHAASAQLSGVKTIDPAGSGTNNYPTFTAAVQALNAAGVGSSGVVFRVKAGATFTESIPALTASGTAASGIQFVKDGRGANPVLQQVGTSSTDAVMTLDGADYVRLDSLTLRDNPVNTTAAERTEYGVWLKNGASNNLVQGCSIELNRENTNRTYGVYLLDGGNNSNRFLNNSVSNCTGAYYFNGTSTVYDTDNTIGATAGGRAQASQIGLPTTGGPTTTTIVYAVYLRSQQRATVSGLQLTGVQSVGSVYGIYSTGASNSATIEGNTLRDISTSAATTGVVEAIYVNDGAVHTISRNRIDNVRATGSTAFAVGIDITGGTTNNISNNFVNNVQAPNSTAGTAVRALSLRGGSTNNVLHNTVLVEYAATVASNKSGAFYISGANTPAYLANNIFVNRVTGLTPGGGGVGAAFFKSTASLTSLAATSGSNLYYAITPSAEHPIFYGVAATPVAAVTLADYKQLAAPAEQTSVTGNPSFVNAATGDLHLTVAGNCALEGRAVPVSTVLVDIDGDLRSTTTPDIGADEFVGTGAGCITARASAKTRWSAHVYPNPTAGDLTVAVQGASEPMVLEVIDALGRSVYRTEIKSTGVLRHSWCLRGQAAGVYLLRLSNGIETSHHRVVLQ